MARMIPAVFDQNTTSAAERTLFYALQDGLDDREWTVIHTLPWLDDRQRFFQQGECDFLLLHPEKGMLALEAKSGTPSYDGNEGRWYHDSLDRAGRSKRAPIANPFDQARRSSHFLNDLLCAQVPGWRDQGLPFGYAVAFPDAANVVGNLPPEMTPELLILESDMARLDKRIPAILGCFNVRTGNIDPDIFNKALDVLRPSFGLVPSLKTAVADANRELVRLTAEQTRVLDGMQRNSRMYVCGGAGTGKTLLIREQARRLAIEMAETTPAGEEAPRVLVLCFNNTLEAVLRDQLADVAGQVDVLTFHSLCVKMVEEVRGKVEFPDRGAKQGHFWNEGLPEQAFDCLESFGRRYQAVLVDEAQDFHSDWWLTVEGLLTEGPDGKPGKFLIFGDEGQDLYRREATLPFTQPVFELTRNCRNTKQIARWVRATAGVAEKKDEGLDRLPDGPDVVELKVEGGGKDAEVDAIRKQLHTWVTVQGIGTDQIVILGRHRLENSCFGGERKLGNITVVGDGAEVGPGCVRYSTIHKFKGLEADFVVLVEVGEEEVERSEHFTVKDGKRMRYVGGSRARVGLVGIGRVSST